MRVRFGTALAASLLLAAAPAFPQAIQNLVLRNSFNPAGSGARGLGMGGAFIAVADDGTAASFNPAGLAQLRRTELALVGFRSDLESEQSFVRNGNADSQLEGFTHGAPEFAGLAIPFEVGGRNLTLQLAYQRSVDLFGRGTAFVSETLRFVDLGIPQAGSASVIADVEPEVSGAFHTVSLAGGYQLTERLALGVAANYWLGDWTASGSTSFRAFSLPPSPVVELLRIDTEFVQKQRLDAFNVNLGLMLRYPWLSIGGVVRLPFAGGYELDETTAARSSGFLIGTAPRLSQTESGATTRLRWPTSTGVGIAIRPLSGLTLAADFSHASWSRTVIEQLPDGSLLTTAPDADPVTGQVPAVFTDRNFFDLQPASVTGTDDTSQWRAGAEYLVQLPKLIVPLRAGIFRDRVPVSDLSTGTSRRIDGWTLGTGISLERLALDVAFEHRTSEGGIGLRLNRGTPVATSVATERVTENRVVASLIYRFDADDPVKRFLKRLFVGGGEGDGDPES